jgi:hypothetical protein
MANRFAKYSAAPSGAPATGNRFSRFGESGAIEAPSNVGGLSPDASPIDYARDSFSVSQAFAPPEPTRLRPMPSMGQMLLEGERNNLLAARQRTDPAVYDGSRGLRKKIAVLEPEYSDLGHVGPNRYIGADGKLATVDKKTQVVLIDPATGQPTVYERNRDAQGTDVTEEPMWKSLARVIAPGLVVNPVVGPPARVANTAGQTVRAATTAERAQAAADDLMSFERAQVPVFAPAFGGTPTQATAKGLSDTFAVGAPLQNALEDTYRGAQAASQRLAGEFGQARTSKEVGDTVSAGIERFKDARPTDVVEDAIRNLPNERLSEIIQSPTSVHSLKTKQGALYERAWRFIPEEMRRGRAVEGETRVMQSPSNTRAVLEEIHNRNRRMTQQSGTNAAPDAATRPIQGGGLLSRMVDAMMNPRWTANLQTLRDMRSEFRRLASGMADTEKNVLKHSDIDRVQSAITQDMIALLQRNAEAYRAIGTQEALRTAAGFQRSIREFQRADRFTRLSMERMETIERLFKAESTEALFRNISNAALAGGKGNLEMLHVLHRTLRPAERGEVAAGIIAEMGKPVGSARGLVQEIGFSVESFMTRWNNMTPEARVLLFGRDHAQALNDFVTVARRLANVEGFANRSNTYRSGGNVLGIAATAGTAVAGGPAGMAYLLGAVGGSYGLSLVLSRPAYARWMARYLALKAQAARVPKAAQRYPALAAHINRLGQAAKRDPELAALYRAIAVENGILEGGDDNGQNEGFPGPQQGYEGPDDQSVIDPHDGRDSTVRPRAELRAYSPSPSENAAYYAREGAEAIGVPSSQAEQFGSGVGKAVSFLTPADDVSDAIEDGSAAGAATAALSFLPGFRGGKKAAETALEVARKELAEIESEAVRLFGERNVGRIMGPNPVPAIPGREVPAETMLEAVKQQKSRLQDAISTKRDELANQPQSKTAVPVTTSKDRMEMEKWVDENPYVQAIKGRQGFPKKAEQKSLVKQFFEEGGELPAQPWGRDMPSAAKAAMAKAFKAKSRGEQKALVDASKDELLSSAREVSRLKGELAGATGAQVATLKRELAEARRELETARGRAKVFETMYNNLLNKTERKG